ncbi:MAG: TonB family protein [Pseudomonadota bacterium]
MISKLGRVFRLVATVSLGASLFLTSPAKADDLVLEPSSEWRFRDYPDRCRASRNFGEGENRTSLWIEQSGEEPYFNLTLIGRPLRNPFGRGVRLQFGEQREIIRSYIATESSRGRPVLTMFGVAMIQPDMDREDETAEQSKQRAEIVEVMEKARAGGITTLRLRTAVVEPIELQLGSLAEPLAFLEICSKNLSTMLSNAGRERSGLAAPAFAIDDENWLRPSDYPTYLVRARMEGTILIRLTVNTQGRASSCFIVNSERPQLFADAFCRALLRRAQFEPARNPSGEAVASYYTFRVSAQVR